MRVVFHPRDMLAPTSLSLSNFVWHVRLGLPFSGSFFVTVLVSTVLFGDIVHGTDRHHSVKKAKKPIVIQVKVDRRLVKDPLEPLEE